jgi:hypothetical protein
VRILGKPEAPERRQMTQKNGGTVTNNGECGEQIWNMPFPHIIYIYSIYLYTYIPVHGYLWKNEICDGFSP